MSKQALKKQIRTGHRTRTGQQVMGPAPVPASIRETTPGGGCAPVGATVPRSWGAACPSGDCTAENLAANLGRMYAGERYPCRELTYWTKFTATAGGLVVFKENSLVTICPTRVIIDWEGTAPAVTCTLDSFTVGNQNQVVGDPIPVAVFQQNSYSIVPYVTDCIKAGIPFAFQISGAGAAKVGYFGIVGPAIG